MSEKTKKQCTVCGKDFYSFRKRQCSRACYFKVYSHRYIRDNTKYVHCMMCGKRFVRAGSHKYCSSDCSYKARQRYLKQRPKVRVQRFRKRCKICGKLFKGTKKDVYCDALCKREYASYMGKKNTALRETIRLLAERGEVGMRDDDSYHLKRLHKNNWLILEDDGYYRLSEWGKQAVAKYFSEF